MPGLALVSASRLTSLATGRGGFPTADEWPWVALLLAVLAFVGVRLLTSVGLTRLESILVAGVSPLMVLVDAPLGQATPRVALAANATGCLIPAVVALMILARRRHAWAEALLLTAVAILASFLSSHVVHDKGILLQYRIPALLVGLLAALLLHRQPDLSGGLAFAAGAIGVIVGADLLHLKELATGNAGRVILGGAGLLDGIFLVAILSAAVGETAAMLLRGLARARSPSKQAA